jgi:hypothetical protein
MTEPTPSIVAFTKHSEYDGGVQAALRGLQIGRLAVDVAPLDKKAMKRKWAPVLKEEKEPEGNSGKNSSRNHGRAAKHHEWSCIPPLSLI